MASLNGSFYNYKLRERILQKSMSIFGLNSPWLLEIASKLNLNLQL